MSLLFVTFLSNIYEGFHLLGYNVFCGPLKINRGFGRTCRLHLQGPRISQHKAGSRQGRLWVISQKIKLSITAAVITSNPTTKFISTQCDVCRLSFCSFATVDSCLLNTNTRIDRKFKIISNVLVKHFYSQLESVHSGRQIAQIALSTNINRRNPVWISSR
jgi:hypothetical protein